MKGSRCCFNCENKLTNIRDEIVPCSGRWECSMYLAQVEAERQARVLASAERRILYQSLLNGRNKNKRR